jgi:hypothetical protein
MTENFDLSFFFPAIKIFSWLQDFQNFPNPHAVIIHGDTYASYALIANRLEDCISQTNLA